MDKGSAIEYVKTEPQVNRLKLLEGVVLVSPCPLVEWTPLTSFNRGWSTFTPRSLCMETCAG